MQAVRAQWVYDQIYDVNANPITSHREYYRRRLNQRAAATYRIGESGPLPCEALSRWRTFAFTMNDVFVSEDLKLTVEKVTIDPPPQEEVSTLAPVSFLFGFARCSTEL